MDLDLSPSEAAFRAEFSSWLDGNLADEGRARALAELPPGFSWDNALGKLRSTLSSPLHDFDLAEETELGMPFGSRLLQMAGIPRDVIADLPPLPRLNESLPTMAVQSMRVLNLVGIGKYVRKTVRRYFT